MRFDDGPLLDHAERSEQKDMTSFDIRFATVEDASALSDIIKDLAAYEQHPSKDVRITPEAIAKYGFGEKPCFECIVCVRDGAIVAYVLYSLRFRASRGAPVIYVEDMFIVPRYRKTRIARQLVTRIGKIAVDRGCCFVEWAVCRWNKSAQHFYKSIGADFREDLFVCRITADKIQSQFKSRGL